MNSERVADGPMHGTSDRRSPTFVAADRVAPRGWLAPSFSGGAATLSLAEQIADRIGAAIVHGTHKPGERLQEQGIAAAFNVSRGPVRDALHILEREGLVVIQARRGASVQQLSEQGVREIFAVRAGLYGLAAEAIAERGDADTVRRLKASVVELKDTLQLNDAEVFLDAIYAKSMYIADACGNALLRTLIYSHGRQTLALTQRAMIVRANQERWYSNWRSMVKAIAQGAASEADVAGRRLVRDVLQMVLAFYDTPEPKTADRAAAPTERTPRRRQA